MSHVDRTNRMFYIKNNILHVYVIHLAYWGQKFDTIDIILSGTCVYPVISFSHTGKVLFIDYKTKNKKSAC